MGVSEYSLSLSTATILVSISLVIRTTQFKDCVTWEGARRGRSDVRNEHRDTRYNDYFTVVLTHVHCKRQRMVYLKSVADGEPNQSSVDSDVDLVLVVTLDDDKQSRK